MSGELPVAALFTLGRKPMALAFFQLGDRTGHRVLCYQDDGTWRVALESIEDEADDAESLATPAYQEIRQSFVASDDESGKAVMLVGAGGGNHWSACVSQDFGPSREADASSFTFDLACRTRTIGGKLGVAYRVASGTTLAATGDALAVKVGDARRVWLRPLPSSDDAERTPTCRVGAHGDSATIECAQRAEASPATLRFRYAITLAD